MFDNFIGGFWTAPELQRYLRLEEWESGWGIRRVPRSSSGDVERALDAAHRARGAWYRLRPGERAVSLARVSDRLDSPGGSPPTLRIQCGFPGDSMESCAVEADLIALKESLDRQLAAFEDDANDWPCPGGVSAVIRLILPVDTGIDAVCRRVIPLLLYGHVMAVVLLYQDAGRERAGLLPLMGLLASALPPGVLNLVSGLGLEAGLALMNSPRAVPPAVLPVPWGVSDRVDEVPEPIAIRA